MPGEIGKSNTRSQSERLDQRPAELLECPLNSRPYDVLLLPQKEGREEGASLTIRQGSICPTGCMATSHLFQQVGGYDISGHIREASICGEMIDEVRLDADSAVDIAKIVGELVQPPNEVLSIIAKDGLAPCSSRSKPNARLEVPLCPECAMRGEKRKSMIAAGMLKHMMINSRPLSERADISGQGCRFPSQEVDNASGIYRSVDHPSCLRVRGYAAVNVEDVVGRQHT